MSMTDNEAKHPLRIGYVADRRLVEESSRLEKVRGRSYMLHSLLNSTGVIKKLVVFPAGQASLEELKIFHSSQYVDFIVNPTAEDEEELGFGYDCPVMERLDDYVRTIAGASLTAAELLVQDRVSVAINWCGGWHHAKRDSAAGFCYVNDIVLAIHRLQTKFKRIMYVDLDVHHGDGVEDAFSSTNKVLTFSIHRAEPGFFPGTGHATDVGYGKGMYHSVNVPLSQGADDRLFSTIFDELFPRLLAKYRPEAFAVQCGADGLAGDELGGFNLTPASLSRAVTKVVEVGLPVLLLGGGGYNIPNTVKCWTRVTCDLTDHEMPEDVPEEDPFFLKYGPDYTTAVDPGLINNKNTEAYMNEILKAAVQNIEMIES